MKAFLKKLKEFPKNRTLIIFTIISFIPFILITIFVFMLNEIELKATTGYGVLEFELARTPEMINTIFNAWGQKEMEKQAIITYIDYIYIIFYSLFGAQSVLIVTRKLEGKLQEVGLYLTLATSIAGIFDAIENINLLLMLSNETFIWSSCPFIASLCSTFKIAFIASGICFLYIASVFLILGKYRVLYIYITLIGSGVIFFCFLSIWSLFVAIITGTVYCILLYIVIRTIKSKN